MSLSGEYCPDSAALPGDYRGIIFSSWLDLILEYAVLLARSANSDKAYSVLKIANDANVFYCSLDSMFLVHVCWFGSYDSFPSLRTIHLLISLQLVH